MSFPYGATLVCVTARMDAALAASLRRIASAGHTVTVLSLAEGEFEDELGRIRVQNVLSAVQSIESREVRETPARRDSSIAGWAREDTP
jgi:hypothetical protein